MRDRKTDRFILLMKFCEQLLSVYVYLAFIDNPFHQLTTLTLIDKTMVVLWITLILAVSIKLRIYVNIHTFFSTGNLNLCLILRKYPLRLQIN